MNCHLLPAMKLRPSERLFLADHLTRSGSDFQRALLAGAPDGTIAMCYSQGEIVGWARTEEWSGMPTLEAFVAPELRGRGVAQYCASALVAAGLLDEPIAVFRESMASLADKLELDHTLYARQEDGSWQEATFPAEILKAARVAAVQAMADSTRAMLEEVVVEAKRDGRLALAFSAAHLQDSLSAFTKVVEEAVKEEE
jgi:GNAT superfamily N-acetyltransferase